MIMQQVGKNRCDETVSQTWKLVGFEDSSSTLFVNVKTEKLERAQLKRSALIDVVNIATCTAWVEYVKYRNDGKQSNKSKELIVLVILLKCDMRFLALFFNIIVLLAVAVGTDGL